VNTRLQVEHGVTELVSGVDIVREQLRIAAGRPLDPATLAAARRASTPERHAIEVRLTAEDPGRGFVPTPGPVTAWRMPGGPGVRVDSGIETGDRVPAEYDNLVAKLLVAARDRDAAIDRLDRALGEVVIGGIQTTLPFHRAVARDAAFRVGDLSTEWVEAHWDGPRERREALERAAVVAGLTTLAVPVSPPGRVGEDREQSGAWRRAARADAVDGWPG
jgi:acetyl/propionyl-CoA carboxylase alpha subunit